MTISKLFKFKERVIVSKKAEWPYTGMPANRKGRVWKREDTGLSSIGVRFDEAMGGHNLGIADCADGFGWYVERKFIRRLPAKGA